jgi:uncharacterized iron-regulated membrane protein
VFRLQGMQPQPQRGPLARLLTSLLLIGVAVVALFFGAILIAILIGLAAILFIFLYLRAWWLRRKLGLNVHPHHSQKPRDAGVTLEGEYTVEKGDNQGRDDQ